MELPPRRELNFEEFEDTKIRLDLGGFLGGSGGAFSGQCWPPSAENEGSKIR